MAEGWLSDDDDDDDNKDPAPAQPQQEDTREIFTLRNLF